MRKERIKHMDRHEINIKHTNKKMMRGKRGGKKDMRENLGRFAEVILGVGSK